MTSCAWQWTSTPSTRTWWPPARSVRAAQQSSTHSSQGTAAFGAFLRGILLLVWFGRSHQAPGFSYCLSSISDCEWLDFRVNWGVIIFQKASFDELPNHLNNLIYRVPSFLPVSKALFSSENTMSIIFSAGIQELYRKGRNRERSQQKLGDLSGDSWETTDTWVLCVYCLPGGSCRSEHCMGNAGWVVPSLEKDQLPLSLMLK